MKYFIYVNDVQVIKLVFRDYQVRMVKLKVGVG